jgi:hypothetical protein
LFGQCGKDAREKEGSRREVVREGGRGRERETETENFFH